MDGWGNLRQHDCCRWGLSVKLLIFLASLLLAGSPSFAADYGSQAEVVCDRNQDLCTCIVISFGLNAL